MLEVPFCMGRKHTTTPLTLELIMWFASDQSNMNRVVITTEALWNIRKFCLHFSHSSQVTIVIKNMSANTENIRDAGSISRLDRSPGEGNGNPLQYSCLENPMDRGAWQATVHGVTKCQTWLMCLSICPASSPPLLHKDSVPQMEVVV